MKHIVYAFRKRNVFLVGIVLYFPIVLFVFKKILFPSEGELVFGNDIHHSYHYFRVFITQAFKSGEIPWWNPYIFSGVPFIANPSVSFWYPPNWLFLIGRYSLVYSWLILFHILLGMISMFWLCRRWMDPASAWFAGLTFGLSGFFMGRLWEGHIDIITSAPYAPLVVGMFWEAFYNSTPKKIIAAAAVFALQIYAGYQTIAFFTGLILFGGMTFFCLIKKSIKPLLTLIVTCLIAFGLAALQIIPNHQFFQNSIRTYSLPYSWVTMGSYSLKQMAQLIEPFIWGGPGADNYVGAGPNFGELAAYVGIIPFILATVTIILMIIKNKMFGKRRAYILLFTIIVFISLWVSFGPNALVDLQYFLWKTIPLYHYLRIPARHLFLFVFAMSILTGFGMSCIRHKFIQYILIIITIVDLALFSGHFILLKPSPELYQDVKLVKKLQEEKDHYRVLPNFNVAWGTRNALGFDAPMEHGIFSASGYDPSILRNYYEFISNANGIENPDVQQSDVQVPFLNAHSPFTDFLNIKYVLVPTWFDSVGDNGRFDKVLEDNKINYWRLYENRSVLPRFYTVSSALVLPTKDEVAAAIRQNRIDPATSVLINDSLAETAIPNCVPKYKADIIVSHYSLNDIKLSTRSICNSFLVSSEVMYPGWEAFIDGNSTQLFEGNLAFRTIYLPAGNHSVEFKFIPTIFYVSGAITFLTILGCLLLYTRGRA